MDFSPAWKLLHILIGSNVRRHIVQLRFQFRMAANVNSCPDFVTVAHDAAAFRHWVAETETSNTPTAYLCTPRKSLRGSARTCACGCVRVLTFQKRCEVRGHISCRPRALAPIPSSSFSCRLNIINLALAWKISGVEPPCFILVPEPLYTGNTTSTSKVNNLLIAGMRKTGQWYRPNLCVQ